MALRRIDAFDTGNAERLTDQLSRFQDSADRELRAKAPRDVFTDWLSDGPAQAVYEEVLRCDTATTAIAVTLPSVSLETVGWRLGVLRLGANAVTLSPVESSVAVDGLAAATLGADGLYVYEHDGSNWYSTSAPAPAPPPVSLLRPELPVTASRSNLVTDTDFTLAFDDASPLSYTVEPDATVPQPDGVLQEIYQKGAGQLTIVQGAGVTVRTAETLRLRKAGAAAQLRKLEANTWLLAGDLELT